MIKVFVDVTNPPSASAENANQGFGDFRHLAKNWTPGSRSADASDAKSNKGKPTKELVTLHKSCFNYRLIEN